MGLVIETFAGDSAPTEMFTIKRTDGSVVNLLGATVWLLIEDPDSGILTNEPSNGKNNLCTIVNALGGLCSYSWNAGGSDLPDPGFYKANLKIKYGDNTVETAAITISARLPIAFIS